MSANFIWLYAVLVLLCIAAVFLFRSSRTVESYRSIRRDLHRAYVLASTALYLVVGTIVLLILTHTEAFRW